MLAFMFVSGMGRPASLASLGSLGACFRCGVQIRFRGCIYVCVRGEVARETRFARLARLPLSLILDFIFVFMLEFMSVSWVGRLASLSSLSSLGAAFVVEFMFGFVFVFMLESGGA